MGGEFVACRYETGNLLTFSQCVDQEGLHLMRVGKPPPGDSPDGRAAGRSGDIDGGTVARPAGRLVGSFHATEHDAIEHDRVARLRKQCSRQQPATARRADRGGDARVQDGPAG